MATVTKPIALNESFNTTETPSRNIADVLASLGDAISQGAQPVTKKLATNSFKTINGGLVDGLTVQFAPVQDLHGQSKPWAGGAGKNLLPIDTDTLKTLNGGAGTWTGNKKTIEGVEVELLTDDDGNTIGIKANRTASSANSCLLNLAFNNFTFMTSSVSYTLNGCPSGGSNNTYALVYQAQTGELYWDSGNGATFTFAGQITGITHVRLVIRPSYSPSDMVFKPMIRLASIADPTFEPYSNICPISGHTDAESDINGTTYTTSLGTTVYGGELDMVSGDGEVTIARVDLGSLSYNYDSANLRYTAYLSGIKDVPVRTMPIKSDIYETIDDGRPYSGAWDNVIYNSGNTVIIHNHAYTDAAAFKTAMSGYYITYDLATPTTLTLTGQNITAEVGVNNVSAPLDGQSIKADSVIYKDMFTWEDVLKVI